MTPDERRLWLEDRRSGLGGSDAGAVLGLSPWRTAWDVYIDKIYGSADDSKTEVQAVGDWLEEPLIRWGAAEMNESAWTSGESVVMGCLRGTLDATFPKSRIIVDCKVGHGWADWTEEIPAHIVAQLNHYRWLKEQATGEEWSCKLAVYHRLLGKRAMYDVPRQPWGPEVLHLTAWWQLHIVDGVPPDIDDSRACTTGLLKLRSPRDEVRVATQQDIANANDLAHLRELGRGIDQDVAALANQLRHSIADSKGLRWSGGRVNWTPSGRITVRIDE